MAVTKKIEIDGNPVEFATVTLPQADQWCMTDRQGAFSLPAKGAGKTLLRVTCVGYEPVELMVDLNHHDDTLRLTMHPTNLLLEQVIVTAQRKNDQLPDRPPGPG